MAGTVTAVRTRAYLRESGRARTRISISWVWLGAILMLTVVALGIRLYRIDGDSLWLDEGYTLLFSGMSLHRLLVVGGAHEHPPLYYLIVHALRAIHESYFIPRYLSASAGALTLPAIYALGARIHTRAAGFIAAVLLAIAPFHVWFGRDGRGYGLAALLVVLSYYSLFTALDAPRRRTWLTYAVCTALCLYAEYTTVFALLPQALLLIRAWKRGHLRAALGSMGLAGALFGPWVLVLAVDTATITGNYWIPAPNPSSWANIVLESLGMVTSCTAQPCTGTEISLPGLAGHEVTIASVTSAIVAGLALGAWWRRDLVIGVLCAWSIIPFVLVLLVSRVQSLFLDRVFLDATFPLYLVIGIGLASLWNRPVPAALLLLVTLGLCAVSVQSLHSIYALGANPDWRSAIRDFRTAYRPGQGVVFYPGALRSLAAAYLPAGWRTTTDVPLWTRAYLDVPGWQDQYPTALRPSVQQRARIEAALRDRQLQAASAGTDGTWLITQDYSNVDDVRHWFTTHGYVLLLSEMYPNDARIEFWKRGGPDSFGTSLARIGDGRWTLRDAALRSGRQLTIEGNGEAIRTFDARPGEVFSVNVGYRGVPSAVPRFGVLVYDVRGRQIADFPATHWYDLPSNGAWVSNPFGFIAPPRSARALLYVASAEGTTQWRDLEVYRER